MDGGDGIDTLSYAPFEAPSRVYFGVRIDVFAGNVTSMEPGFVEVNNSFSNFERFVGGNQADRLIGGIAPDYLDGLGGNDLINGSFLGDTILGGAGDDELRGEAGDDNIQGGDGIDKLIGGTGKDTMAGGIGKDEFEGNEPDDPPDEDQVTDWEGMGAEPSCSGASPCDP
jgi:Ca2+-binding RTX toxin-like protein